MKSDNEKDHLQGKGYPLRSKTKEFYDFFSFAGFRVTLEPTK
jgi:hypothetical protein